MTHLSNAKINIKFLFPKLNSIFYNYIAPNGDNPSFLSFRYFGVIRFNLCKLFPPRPLYSHHYASSSGEYFSIRTDNNLSLAELCAFSYDFVPKLYREERNEPLYNSLCATYTFRYCYCLGKTIVSLSTIRYEQTVLVRLP